MLTRNLVHHSVLALGGINYNSFKRKFQTFGLMTAEDQSQFQFEQLNRLLRNFGSKSSFYQALHGQRDFGKDPVATRTDLASIIPLTKDHLRSETILSQAEVPPRGITKVQTTGTTGIPVTVFKNRETHASQIARRRLCFEQIGIDYGAREARFWGSNSGPSGFSLRDLLLNRQTFTFLDDDSRNRNAADRLLEFCPDYFYGYSTMILAAAELWERHKLALPQLQGIVCTAEGLTEFQRRFIARVFDCPVFMEYGCSEVDLIAMQCREGTYHLPAYHVLLEVHPEGALEGEAIVTDLTNTLMPLIRYRLGDDITLTQDPCPCGQLGPAISAISGRTLAQIITLPDGRTVHAVIFAHLFEKLFNAGHAIDRFKAWQESPDQFLVRVETKSAGSTAELSELIRRGTCEALDCEVGVEVRYEKIPAQAGTKFTYFVPMADQ